LLVGLVVLSALAALPSQATDTGVSGGPGGGPFREVCPGQFLVGVTIRAGAWVDAISPLCATFLAPQGYFGPWIRGAYHGGQGGSARSGACPKDRFVGKIRFGWTRKDTKPEFVDYVELTCVLVSDQSSADTTKVCLPTGGGCWDSHPNPPPGDILGTPFGPYPPLHEACPLNEAATGLLGRSGVYVDALGLVCGPRPTLAAAPAPPPAAGPTYTNPPIKKLGKARLVAKAKNDVDVYNNPVEPRAIIGIMRFGVRAPVLTSHRDGWYKLQGVAAGVDGWVAADHLEVTRAP
jgi:hypothetical protein